MRLAEDSTSWKASSIQRRDFRHIANGPEITGKPKKKKNTRRWCRGVEGREHQLVVVKGDRDYFGKGCHEPPANHWFEGEWICYHEEKCSTCGKILEWTMKDRCPDKPCV